MRKISVSQIILSVVMVLITLTMLVPIINILAVSLSGPTGSIRMSGLDLIPKEFSLDNYRLVLSHQHLFQSLLNSVFMTVTGVAINVLLTTTAAFVLVQPKLMFKKAIMVFLIIMMLFDDTGRIPEYLVIQSLGLMGTQWSVILSGSVNVFYLVIMMRFFQEIPPSILEAARIDGAGHLTVFFRVAAPLSKIGIATIGMFYAVLRWNEYVRAGIYILSPSLTTLQVVLRNFIVNNDTTSLVGAGNLMSYNDLARMDYTAIKYATIIVSILPILMLYPVILKFYTKDVMSGAVKE